MAINGLNKITDKIIAEAQEAANRILGEAQKDCDRIREEYRQQAETTRDTLSREAKQKANDYAARTKSTTAMQQRNLIQQRKSDLIDEVFAEAFEWVRRRSTQDYTELVIGLLAAAVLEVRDTEDRNLALYGAEEDPAPEKYEILLNRKDRAAIGETVVEALRKRLAGKLSADRLAKICLSGQIAAIDGGAILKYGDIESNCSLGMLFSQLRRELETDVSRVLFTFREQA